MGRYVAKFHSEVVFILFRGLPEGEDREVKVEAKDHQYVFTLLTSNYFNSSSKNQLELFSSVTSLKSLITTA